MQGTGPCQYHEMNTKIVKRRCFLAIGLITIVYALVMIGVYLISKESMLTQAQMDAQRNVDVASALITKELEAARTVVRNTPLPSTLEEGRDYVEGLVRNNKNIYGAAIALKPEVSQKIYGKDRHMLYAYRVAADEIYTLLLSEEGYYYYPEREWYTYPTTYGKEHWTEPYHDSLTNHQMMVSYSQPFMYQDSLNVGAILIDISINDGLYNIINEIDAASPFRTYVLSKNKDVIFGDSSKGPKDMTADAQLPDRDWTVCQVIEYKKVMAPLYTLLSEITFFYVILILAVCCCLYFLGFKKRPSKT